MLIDSHCHLDFPALAKDREGAVARARAAGVARMVNVCTRRREFDILRAESIDDVFCCLGIHPHHVSEGGEDVSTEEIVKASAHPKVVGIGETGLIISITPRRTRRRNKVSAATSAPRSRLTSGRHS